MARATRRCGDMAVPYPSDGMTPFFTLFPFKNGDVPYKMGGAVVHNILWFVLFTGAIYQFLLYNPPGLCEDILGTVT